MSERPLFDELLIAARLFKRTQVCSLKILDESKLEDLSVRDVFDNYWYFFKTSKLSSLVSSLTCNDLILSSLLSNKKGLKNAILLNRVRKLRKLRFLKQLSRLIFVRNNLSNL